MALLIKSGPRGASSAGLRPEMLVALQVADGLYREHGIDCVVTSGTEGKHRRGSLHYTGLALDLRTWNLPAHVDVITVAADLARNLGDDFDVVPEKIGQRGEHLHVEFHPDVSVNMRPKR